MVVYRLDDRSPGEEITFMTWSTADFLLGTNAGDVKVVRVNEEEMTFDGFQASHHGINFMALDRAGRLLAVVARKSELCIWNWTDEDGWSREHRLPAPDSRLAVGEPVAITSLNWSNVEEGTLIVSYLNHGVLQWKVATQTFDSLLNIDKVYSGSLSPDGRFFAIPNRKLTFDLHDLRSKSKVDTFKDPEALTHSASLLTQQLRPGVFLHEGRYFVGASVGKINLWNTTRNIRAQHLNLGEDFIDAPVAFLTVSQTGADDLIDNFRIATCVQGPKQQIEVWKAREYLKAANILPAAVAGNAAPVTDYWMNRGCQAATVVAGLIGGIIGGAAVRAFANGLPP
ncbi:hypothetical protein H1R20_g15024, partial [Candolleomyces eurysporus]